MRSTMKDGGLCELTIEFAENNNNARSLDVDKISNAFDLAKP